jgi:antitoxin component YwqK of YwqJK toxin-antitoxin module
MKKLTSLTALLLLLAGCEVEIYKGELIEREGRYYKPNEPEPFAGEHQLIDVDRNLEVRRRWHANGRLRFEATYQDGKQVGMRRSWHDNGQLRVETPYQDGMQEGIERWWLKNGEPGHEICYIYGEEEELTYCQ